MSIRLCNYSYLYFWFYVLSLENLWLDWPHYILAHGKEMYYFVGPHNQENLKIMDNEIINYSSRFE